MSIEVIHRDTLILSGIFENDLVRKRDEVLSFAGFVDPCRCLARFDLGCGEHRLGFMADIFIVPALRFSAVQGKNWLGAIKRLNAGFCIAADNQRVFGRVHLEIHHLKQHLSNPKSEVRNFRHPDPALVDHDV